MSDETAEPEVPKKKKLIPLLVGVALAGVLGAGGYFAASSGLLGGSSEKASKSELDVKKEAKAAFVPLDPLVVSLGETGQRHLRFQAQLEVEPGTEAEVAAVLPRVMDVLNGYLRAIDIAEIQNPSTLVRTRAQMLRRVQIIVGDEKVKDILVMEFVVS